MREGFCRFAIHTQAWSSPREEGLHYNSIGDLKTIQVWNIIVLFSLRLNHHLKKIYYGQVAMTVLSVLVKTVVQLGKKFCM